MEELKFSENDINHLIGELLPRVASRDDEYIWCFGFGFTKAMSNIRSGSFKITNNVCCALGKFFLFYSLNLIRSTIVALHITFRILPKVAISEQKT